MDAVDWSSLGRRQTTKTLGDMLVGDVFHFPDARVYWAREVTFDYMSAHTIRVDFMRYKPRNTTISGLESGEFHCFEIKSCVADFKSGNGLNFIGDRNYIVCPPEMVEYAKLHVPFGVGIYAPSAGADGRTTLHCVKPSRLDYRSRSALECLFMMTRSMGRDAITAWGENATRCIK